MSILARGASRRLVFVELRLNGGFDLFVKRLIALESVFRGVAALGELSALIVQPRAALLDDLFFQGKIEKGSG